MAFAGAVAALVVTMRHIAGVTGGVAARGTSPEALEAALVAAAHRSSGLMVAEGRGREVSFDVPIGAAGLRLTAVAGEGGGGRSVRMVSLSGKTVNAAIEAGPPGTPGIALLSVPEPEAGTWRLEAPVEVTTVASAQPGPEEATERPAPPDPDPPAVAGRPSLSVDGPDLASDVATVTPWTLVVAGGFLVLAGGVGGTVGRARRRRFGRWLELSSSPGGGRLLARSGDRVGVRHDARVVAHEGEWFSVLLRPAQEGDADTGASVLRPGDTLAAGSRTLSVIGEADRRPAWHERLALRSPSPGPLVLAVLLLVQLVLVVQLVVVLR